MSWIKLDPPESFDTFAKRWHDRSSMVGVQIRLEADGVGYLIGDINPQGGLCDDCNLFDDKDLITEWCRWGQKP